MEKKLKLGIWMDHSSAHLIEYVPLSQETTYLEAKLSHQSMVRSHSKSENLMHKLELHMQSDFYAKIGTVIKAFDEVVLFGPSNSKVELLNYLRKDPLLADIKIELEKADFLTESEQLSFVREYFTGKRFAKFNDNNAQSQ